MEKFVKTIARQQKRADHTDWKFSAYRKIILRHGCAAAVRMSYYAPIVFDWDLEDVAAKRVVKEIGSRKRVFLFFQKLN